MLSIALSELIQIFRNRSVLISGFIFPIASSAGFVWQHEVFTKIGSLGYVASTVVFTVTAFTLYAATVTMLASRRQNLFLKRLRSTAATDSSILLGLVLPVTVIAMVQIVGMLIVLTMVGSGPESLLLFTAGGLATVAMMLALGLATAGLTNSPEHAQVTTLPISLGAIAVASWVGISGTEELTAIKRMLPGGSATELMVNAWNGGSAASDSLLLLAPTLAWVAGAAWLALTMFRWEPRR